MNNNLPMDRQNIADIPEVSDLEALADLYGVSIVRNLDDDGWDYMGNEKQLEGFYKDKERLDEGATYEELEQEFVERQANLPIWRQCFKTMTIWRQCFKTMTIKEKMIKAVELIDESPDNWAVKNGLDPDLAQNILEELTDYYVYDAQSVREAGADLSLMIDAYTEKDSDSYCSLEQINEVIQQFLINFNEK